MTRTLAALAAVGALLASSPAASAQEQTAFDQRVDLQLQSWSWISPTGGLTYTAPMVVFTVTDHTGGVLGAMSTVAGNEARRRQAERDAIRKGENRYQWEVQEARAMRGSRFSFMVGQGGIGAGTNAGGAPSLTGSSGTSRMARIGIAGDIVPIGPGALVFDSGVAYWSALALDPTGKSVLDIEAWNYPLGLSYRFVPGFVPGLTLEPGFSFDWLYTLYYGMGGNWRFDARNVWVEAGYQLHPQVKLRGGLQLNRLAHNQVGWMKTEEVVDMTNLTAGLTLRF